MGCGDARASKFLELLGLCRLAGSLVKDTGLLGLALRGSERRRARVLTRLSDFGRSLRNHHRHLLSRLQLRLLGHCIGFGWLFVFVLRFGVLLKNLDCDLHFGVHFLNLVKIKLFVADEMLAPHGVSSGLARRLPPV